MPRPPPEMPESGWALAMCGSGWLSTWLGGGFCGSEPVVSLRAALFVPNRSAKRPESLLQPAALNPSKETATNCGQRADRRDAHMVTRSYTQQHWRATKQGCGKQAFKRGHPTFNKIGCVAGSLQFAGLTGQERHKAHGDQVFARQFAVRRLNQLDNGL